MLRRVHVYSQLGRADGDGNEDGDDDDEEGEKDCVLVRSKVSSRGERGSEWDRGWRYAGSVPTS